MTYTHTHTHDYHQIIFHRHNKQILPNNKKKWQLISIKLSCFLWSKNCCCYYYYNQERNMNKTKKNQT